VAVEEVVNEKLIGPVMNGSLHTVSLLSDRVAKTIIQSLWGREGKKARVGLQVL